MQLLKRPMHACVRVTHSLFDWWAATAAECLYVHGLDDPAASYWYRGGARVYSTCICSRFRHPNSLHVCSNHSACRWRTLVSQTDQRLVAAQLRLLQLLSLGVPGANAHKPSQAWPPCRYRWAGSSCFSNPPLLVDSALRSATCPSPVRQFQVSPVSPVSPSVTGPSHSSKWYVCCCLWKSEAAAYTANHLAALLTQCRVVAASSVMTVITPQLLVLKHNDNKQLLQQLSIPARQW